jgi:hypothetical protein
MFLQENVTGVIKFCSIPLMDKFERGTTGGEIINAAEAAEFHIIGTHPSKRGSQIVSLCV